MVVRSLADDLRQRTDTQLAELVAARPDLLHPVPADLGALAARAASPASVAAALRAYDQLALHVGLAMALAPDAFRTDDVVAPLVARVGGPEAAGRVRAAVERLARDALTWSDGGSTHLVVAARDLLVPVDRGPRVAALDPVVEGYAAQPDALRDLLAGAPAVVAELVRTLSAGPVTGTVSGAQRVPDPARTPIDWLLAHHLLVPVGDGRVVMPAEVVAIVRGATADDPVLAPVPLHPPEPAAGAADPARVDSGAVPAVLDHLHRTEALCRLWADTPPTRLRTGGVAMRDLTTAARALRCTEAEAALVIEVAEAAGLVAADTHAVVAFLPTRAFDAWLGATPAERHAQLLTAWLRLPRTAVAGARPLAAERTSPAVVGVRRDVLAALARAPGPWSMDELRAALDWWAPRRGVPERAEWAGQVLAEAGILGIASGGALTSAGRALAAGDPDGLVRALAAGLPGVVDRVIMQADLTAVVPGIPAAGLAELLRLSADVESTGVATVLRFSASSVGRALDAGFSADDLLAELGRRGAVPQPLAYLVTDVARRHAALRVGSAGTYLRCDDPALLARILADPGLAGLGLTRLADSVLACPDPPEVVLERLRRAGLSPVPEGGLDVAAPGTRRARGRGPAEEPAAAVTPALAAAAVRAMRATDRPGHEGRRGARPTAGIGHPVPIQDQSQVMRALREAIAAERTVWIGYADPTGTATDRRVEPLRLSGGYLTALDLRTEAVTTFALARIAGVEPEQPAGPGAVDGPPVSRPSR